MLSPEETIVCRKIAENFESTMILLEKSLGPYVKALNQFKAALRQIAAVRDILDSEIEDLKSQIDQSTADKIPDTESPEAAEEASRKIEDIIRKCPYLEGDNILGELLGLLNTIDDTLRNILSRALDELADAIDPFLKLFLLPAKLLAELERLFKKLGIGDLFDKLDKMLDCLEAICGEDVTPKRENLNILRGRYYLSPDNKVDLQKIYDEYGISAQKQKAINEAKSQIDTAEKNATDSLNRVKDNVLDKYKKVTGIF